MQKEVSLLEVIRGVQQEKHVVEVVELLRGMVELGTVEKVQWLEGHTEQ